MRPSRDFLIGSLHILVLWNFAVSQPLFDLLSQHAAFFAMRQSQPVDVLLLVFVLSVLFPILIILGESITGLLGNKAQKAVHSLVVSGLVAAIVLQGLGWISEIPGLLLLVVALAGGMGFAFGYVRFPSIRTFVTFLSPTVLLFPGIFLLGSPVSKFVLPDPGASAAAVKVGNPAPLIIVLFDELPLTSLMDEHRQIDLIRYPNFASLARHAIWFRNATTVAENTVWGVPAILTGNYPEPGRLPTYDDYPRNLFTLLGDTYRLKVFGLPGALCPDQLCEKPTSKVPERMAFLLSDLSIVYLHVLLPTDLAAKLPSISHKWMNFAGEKKTNTQGKGDPVINKVFIQHMLFIQHVDDIEPTDEPVLYLLYSMIPHIPYNYYPSGKMYAVDTRFPLGIVHPDRWGSDEWAVIQGYQRHLLQVGLADTLLGELLDHLKAVGLYDRSLIVVASDHGASFYPGEPRRPLTETNFHDIMPVPLLVKAPHQREGTISDRNVEVIDILPTIADILGIELPWTVDGTSALAPAAPDRKQKVIFFDNAKQRLLLDASALDAKYTTLDRKISLFGSGAQDRLFKIGPFAELVGREVSEVGVIGERALPVSLDQAPAFEDVDPDAGFLPGLITGRVDSGDDGVELEKLVLAVAVNGTIRAITRPYTSVKGKTGRWTAVVEESSFRRGKNDVQVYLVSESRGRPVLEHPTRITYFLSVDKTGDEIIKSSQGDAIPVVEGALRAHLDVAEEEKGFVLFAGWAADVENSEVAERILIFVDGRLFYAGRLNTGRPGVAQSFAKPALLWSGFRYRFPSSIFGSQRELRFFAIFRGGVASELKYPTDYRWGGDREEIRSARLSGRSRSLGLARPSPLSVSSRADGTIIRTWSPLRRSPQ